jgi:outer membrane protein
LTACASAAIGARSVIDILDAETELFRAEVARVRAEREQVVAAYRLLAAIGRLTAEDLGLPVAYDAAEIEGAAGRERWFDLGSDLPDD